MAQFKLSFLAALSLSVLMIAVRSELVFEDADLQKKYGQPKIRHFLATVGRLPYGRSRRFQLVPITPKECDDIALPSNYTQSDAKPALILKSDGCSFLPQIKKAETKGAAMVVLVNNKNLNFSEINQSVRDPMAAKLTIPVLIVSEETGQLLTLIASEAKVDPVVALKVENQKSENVRITANLKLDEAPMFELLAEMLPYLDKFQNKINISFLIFKKERQDFERAKVQMVLNCLDAKSSIRMLVGFRQNCFNNPEIFKCFSAQSKSLKSEDESKFFTCAQSNDYMALMSKMNIQTDYSNSFLLINQSVYLGLLKMSSVLQPICGGFLETPDLCELRDDNYIVNADSNLLGSQGGAGIVTGVVIQILSLIIALCLFFILLAVILRQLYHRIIQKRFEGVVGHSMNSYQTVSVRTDY